MQTLKYEGPFASVRVPSLGIVVERGGTVDVEDDRAAKRLLRSPNWSEVKPAKAADKPKETK